MDCNRCLQACNKTVVSSVPIEKRLASIWMPFVSSSLFHSLDEKDPLELGICARVCFIGRRTQAHLQIWRAATYNGTMGNSTRIRRHRQVLPRFRSLVVGLSDFPCSIAKPGCWSNLNWLSSWQCVCAFRHLSGEDNGCYYHTSTERRKHRATSKYTCCVARHACNRRMSPACQRSEGRDVLKLHYTGTYSLKSAD